MTIEIGIGMAAAVCIGCMAFGFLIASPFRETESESDSVITPSATDCVLAEIAAERARQIEVEGFTSALDDCSAGALASAAGCYAIHAGLTEKERKYPLTQRYAPHAWPWHRDWWKPKTPRQDLVRAGALIVAEIERLDRAKGRQGDTDNG